MKRNASQCVVLICKQVFVVSALCLVSCIVWSQRVEAAQPTSSVIESGWEFRAVSNTDRTDVKEWHPAQVPGVVQTDLLRNKLIAEPFHQDNEFTLQWIGLTDWEYRTQLPVEAATLAHSHIDLVFEGLDTFADVYVNDNAVLHSENMFRRWRLPAKTLLRPGNNSLRTSFIQQ